MMTLIGPRGAGKTTLGLKLAERVKARFIDLDLIIEMDHGHSISEIFELEGEAAFRNIERDLFLKHHNEPGQILATGGGIVLHPASRDELASNGNTVLLLAEATVLAERIRGSNRPSLTGMQPEDEIERILLQRLDLYMSCAEKTVWTDQQTPEETLDVLEQFWKHFSGHQLR
jgi:shikimate kinase